MYFQIAFSSLGAALSWIFSRVAGSSIMAWFFVFLSILQPLVFKVISLLGFTSVTLIGINLVTDVIVFQLESQLNTLPSDVLSIMGIMQLDKAFSLILSSLAIKQILNGWNSGSKNINSFNPSVSNSSIPINSKKF